MKKILIATTALVATTTVAVADVTISGLGRFGYDYQEDREYDDGSDGEHQLDSRLRMNIDATATTDGGIEFGGRFRLQSDNDESDGSSNVGAFNGPRLYVAAAGLRVEVGNISGVTDSESTLRTFGYEPGLTFNTGHYVTWGADYPAYTTGDEGINGISAQYMIGDFTVMASYSDDWDDNTTTTADDGDFDETAEIGARYAFGGWAVGAVYGTAEGNDRDDQEFYAASLEGTIGPADLVFFVGDTDTDGDDVAYGISAAFPVGAATTIEASYAGGGADDLDDAFGIGFDHSLGGGVTLQGMFGQNESGDGIADLGVLFTF